MFHAETFTIVSNHFIAQRDITNVLNISKLCFYGMNNHNTDTKGIKFKSFKEFCTNTVCTHPESGLINLGDFCIAGSGTIDVYIASKYPFPCVLKEAFFKIYFLIKHL